MSYRVDYKSKLGRAGTVEVARPEDARRVAKRVVRSWDPRDDVIELRFLRMDRIKAAKRKKVRA
jgi:hypothetical protein